MRIRTIKPEFFKHDVVATLDPRTRLLFIGLWCLADCEGRLEDRPERIRVEVLPYEKKFNVNDALEKLHSVGLICRYKNAEASYIQVVAFKTHQRITGKEAEGTSRIPPPSIEELGKQRGNNCEAPGTTGREGKGNGKEGKGTGKFDCPAGAGPTGDDEWMQTLKGNPAYAGIDVDREYAKMRAWCEAHQKQPSRRRFVNWLNRCERPIVAQPREAYGKDYFERRDRLEREKAEREANEAKAAELCADLLEGEPAA